MGRAFKDQIIWLSRAWDGWSEAEQVVALYSVARKLSPIPTRFLQILLTFNFPQDGNIDIVAIEAQANDPSEFYFFFYACKIFFFSVSNFFFQKLYY